MMKINVDACSCSVSDHSVFMLYMKLCFYTTHENSLTMLVNIKQQSMKKQTIAVQLQSQMTCSCILHYHLQQNHIQAIKLNYKKN